MPFYFLIKNGKIEKLLWSQKYMDIYEKKNSKN